MGTEHETDQGGTGGGERVATLWSCSQDDEVLTHTDPDDAITDYLENVYTGEVKDMPATVTVYGFAPMVIPDIFTSALVCWVLEDILERLDEDYGNQIDLDPTTPGNEMKDAARLYVATILKHYDIWSCEQVCKEEHPTNVATRWSDGTEVTT